MCLSHSMCRLSVAICIMIRWRPWVACDFKERDKHKRERGEREPTTPIETRCGMHAGMCAWAGSELGYCLLLRCSSTSIGRCRFLPIRGPFILSPHPMHALSRNPFLCSSTHPLLCIFFPVQSASCFQHASISGHLVQPRFVNRRSRPAHRAGHNPPRPFPFALYRVVSVRVSGT